MLKQRLLTAFILIVALLLVLFYLPSLAFLYLTAFVTLLGAWEWTNLMGVKETGWRAAYLILLVYLGYGTLYMPVFQFLLLSTLWWCLAAASVFVYPKWSEFWSRGDLPRALMGVFVLVPCWGAVNYIRNQADGVYILLFLLVLIWGADSAAYFGGKKWGRRKLAASVSPGKTWEGFASAMAFTIIYSILVFWLDNMPMETWVWGVLLALVTVCFSIIGDLTESMLKRQAGLKDSGALLPGHGGLLDRIDSLTAAAPVFAFGALLIGMYVG